MCAANAVSIVIRIGRADTPSSWALPNLIWCHVVLHMKGALGISMGIKLYGLTSPKICHKWPGKARKTQLNGAYASLAAQMRGKHIQIQICN